MTIKELIEKLSKYDQESVVVVMGYEDGYDDPVIYPCPVDIMFDVNWDGIKKPTRRYGRHDSPDTLDISKWNKAVLIGR